MLCVCLGVCGGGLVVWGFLGRGQGAESNMHVTCTVIREVRGGGGVWEGGQGVESSVHVTCAVICEVCVWGLVVRDNKTAALLCGSPS